MNCYRFIGSEFLLLSKNGSGEVGGPRDILDQRNQLLTDGPMSVYESTQRIYI